MALLKHGSIVQGGPRNANPVPELCTGQGLSNGWVQPTPWFGGGTGAPRAVLASEGTKAFTRHMVLPILPFLSFLLSHYGATHSANNILEDISNMFDDLADQLDAMLD